MCGREVPGPCWERRDLPGLGGPSGPRDLSSLAFRPEGSFHTRRPPRASQVVLPEGRCCLHGNPGLWVLGLCREVCAQLPMVLADPGTSA